jgi:hypothetical protein
MNDNALTIPIDPADTMTFVPVHPVTGKPVEGFTMSLCRPDTRTFTLLAAAIGAVAEQLRRDHADQPQEALNLLLASATVGIMTTGWRGALIGTGELTFSVNTATKLAGQNPWLAMQILAAIDSPGCFERAASDNIEPATVH